MYFVCKPVVQDVQEILSKNKLKVTESSLWKLHQVGMRPARNDEDNPDPVLNESLYAFDTISVESDAP